MPILLIIFGLASLWDGFTTIYGTVGILGNGPTQVIASIVFAVVIMAILLCTSLIWKIGSDDVMGTIMRGFWIIAIGYDLFTSYLGNQHFVMSDDVNGPQKLLLIGLTLLVTASPICASWVWERLEH